VSSFVMFSVDFTHFQFRTSESRPLAYLFVDNDAKSFKPMAVFWTRIIGVHFLGLT